MGVLDQVVLLPANYRHAVAVSAVAVCPPCNPPLLFACPLLPLPLPPLHPLGMGVLGKVVLLLLVPTNPVRNSACAAAAACLLLLLLSPGHGCAAQGCC
jgi:hypothetical protein